MMDKRGWYAENAASDEQREWLPRIKLVKGQFEISDRNGDRDGEPVGKDGKFSAVVVHKVFQRRLWEGYPEGRMVCAAVKAEGMRGMVPHFHNPRAAHCGICPHNKQGDKTCNSGIEFVLGRIGRDKSDDLFVLRGSGLTVGAWINLENKREEGDLPLMAHRLIFQATEHKSAPVPIVGIGKMKEVTDDEFEQFVKPNFEKAVETLKPIQYGDVQDAAPSSAEETTGNAPGANGGGEAIDKPEFDDLDSERYSFHLEWRSLGVEASRNAAAAGVD